MSTNDHDAPLEDETKIANVDQNPIEESEILATEAFPKLQSESLSSDMSGQSIGPYKLLGLLGSGGMGQVYRAKQSTPVKRTVALKLIKAGMDSSQVIARFEVERQALALMDHPNIAHVLDAGTTQNGNPYFVMELVEGKPINEFCDAHRLQPNERLKLFIQVCKAVQHAHQKGIIHRDIKPTNVLVSMVDDLPQAKVIDFGLAKATSQHQIDTSLFTQIGQLVGTPAYMSPEQANLTSLDIDTRTDVYSLGVLLYELMTGATPIDIKSIRNVLFSEIQKMICEVESPEMIRKLSSLDRQKSNVAKNRSIDWSRLAQMVRGDLNVIVMKALEKDRERRYDSPSSLADDIKRLLNNEAILARKASTWYRAKRFVQRNRLSVAAATLVLSSMVVGTIVSATQAYRAFEAEKLATRRLTELELEQQKTLEALTQSQQQEKRAIQAEANAVKEADTAKAINNFLKYDLIAEAAPSKNPRNQQITVEQLVLRASERVGRNFKDRPLVQIQLRNVLGETLVGLGNLSEAEKQFKLSLILMKAELGEKHADTLHGINNVGLIQKFQGKYEEAEENYIKALALQREVLGVQDSATLGTMNNLAMLYSTIGQYSKAEPLFVESLAGCRELLGDTHDDTMQTLNNLAGLYQSMGKNKEAIEMFEEALRLRKKISGIEAPGTLSTMGNLALYYQNQKDYAKAEELFSQAWDISQSVNGAEHFVSLTFKNNLGRLYHDQGKIEKAIKTLKSVLESRRVVLTDQHPDTLGTMFRLANVLNSQNDFENAKSLFLEYLNAIEKANPNTKRHWTTLEHVGNVLAENGDFEESIRHLRKCLITQAKAKANPLQIAQTKTFLGVAITGHADSLEESSKQKSAEFDEAEKLLISGHRELAQSDFGKTESGKEHVAEARQRLVHFYETRKADGDPEKALKLKTNPSSDEE